MALKFLILDMALYKETNCRIVKKICVHVPSFKHVITTTK